MLQACSKEPAVSQAAIALGALHERLSKSPSVDCSRDIEACFPIRQYARALSQLRQYLATNKELDLSIVLICALIHVSIEAIQNNYTNALVHLENSLHLLQSSNDRNTAIGKASLGSTINTELNRAFTRLDLHASAFVAMRPPSMTQTSVMVTIPGRFSILSQAKDVLDQITAHLYFFNRTIAEEFKYRKQKDFPLEAIAEASQIKAEFDTWNERFERFLHRSTSKFSRQEQIVIDVLIINHRIGCVEAATCIHSEATIFDQFDYEFDEIVTLAANVMRSRKQRTTFDFQLDMGIISPLYSTATNCREPWIRKRAMTLLRSIQFREGVWNAVAQAAIAQVAIDRENSFMDPSNLEDRPQEFARVHSVGANVYDPVKRMAEVNLTQKLNGLDGPWHNHVEWCSW